jgi:hypothetical protein
MVYKQTTYHRPQTKAQSPSKAKAKAKAISQGIEMRFFFRFFVCELLCGVFVFSSDKRVKQSNADVGCLSAPHAERRSGGAPGLYPLQSPLPRAHAAHKGAAVVSKAV